ncbi:pentraxin-related protein PTX3 [Betta splendens]|uniref:Pentraxin-related protein PTX3 n=1 Tax=Betta splendens TaxID=158456 RepID=A0A6P7P9N6_BETSP|nr:pentraxin-related protein PTX3 [Betta splendens]
MFPWRLLRAVCALTVCVRLAFAYEDDIEVKFADNYFNEITEEDKAEPTPSPAPCPSRDLNKWDKIFSMLENSQMRENMLLQYVDDIVKVEMGSLRGEMLSFVAQYGGSCGVAVETAGRRMASQLESQLSDALERLLPGDASRAGRPGGVEAALQQLLSAAHTHASRLSKLEAGCLAGPGTGPGAGPGPGAAMKTGFELPESGAAGHREQEVHGDGAAAADGVLDALQQARTGLDQALMSLRQRSLPAGCDMALLFPMRSRRIYAAVVPDAPLATSAFTVCMWVRPTAAANKTVLLSYGNRRNPYEIQLLLSRTSAFFTIGGEAHLVEARGAVTPGRWLHLCGTWSSGRGLASLWAGGRKAASTAGVAEGHVLPDGGSLQLGQERNGCCPAAPGFEGGFDAKLAFAGAMTGVNMWDRVLSEAEIAQLALPEGRGCERRGDVVAWGVTEMQPHGGAQFVN